MARRALQLSLPAPRTWGGRRPGAGRKPTPGRRPGVPHRPRPRHRAAHPVHVTLRATDAVRCLRAARVFPAVRRGLAAASHSGFRIIHYSVQNDHIHLIIEAVNHAIGRRGAVWGDRYHARALATPRAVRHALVYVLMNFKKHRTAVGEVDPCSSAAWFDGWRAEPGARAPRGPSPVARAQSWLAAVGWRRHGLIDVDERPRTDRRVRAPRPRRGGERQTLGPPWPHTHHAARDAARRMPVSVEPLLDTSARLPPLGWRAMAPAPPTGKRPADSRGR